MRPKQGEANYQSFFRHSSPFIGFKITKLNSESDFWIWLSNTIRAEGESKSNNHYFSKKIFYLLFNNLKQIHYHSVLTPSGASKRVGFYIVSESIYVNLKN